MIRKLFSVFAAFGFAAMLQAQVWTSSTLSAGINLISTNGVAIKYLQLIDTSGAANTIVIYDNDSDSSTNVTTPAYTSRVTYSTNRVSTYTDINGVSQSWTNKALISANVAVGATTAEARRVWVCTVPANGTVLWEPSIAAGTSFGLQVWATAGASYNLQYTPLP